MAKQTKSEQTESSSAPGAKQESKARTESLPSWPDYIKSASTHEITKRFSSEINGIIANHSDLQEEYCLLFLLNSAGRIGSFDLDQIFHVLPSLNPDREKIHSPDALEHRGND